MGLKRGHSNPTSFQRSDIMTRRKFAVIKYKKRKNEKKASKSLLVEFKPGNKKKARPFNKNNEPGYWLNRWFNNKY